MPRFIIDVIGKVFDLEKLVIIDGGRTTIYEVLSSPGYAILSILTIVLYISIRLDYIIKLFKYSEMAKYIYSFEEVAYGKVSDVKIVKTSFSDKSYAMVKYSINGVKYSVKVRKFNLKVGDEVNVFYCKHSYDYVMIERDYVKYIDSVWSSIGKELIKTVCIFVLFNIIASGVIMLKAEFIAQNM